MAGGKSWCQGCSFGLTMEGPRGVSLHPNSDSRLGEPRQLGYEILSPGVGLGPSGPSDL